MGQESTPSLGSWIRASRKRVRWTQAELGQLLRVSQGTVSHWEKGTVVPSEAHQAKMEELFGGAPGQLEIPVAQAPAERPDPPAAGAGKPGKQGAKSKKAYPPPVPDHHKRYVLPIIFLRFLSVRYEQRRTQLVSEVREPQSPYYAESPEEAELVIEDDDSYRSANVFPVPAAARWEELRKHAQADDIKLRLDRALEALEEAYPLKLKGLLPRVFAGSNLSRENVTGLINLSFSPEITLREATVGEVSQVCF